MPVVEILVGGPIRQADGALFMPRVTVGLPVYNGQEYLAETLDSLLAQS
jgi:hypothetical protein